MNELYDRIVRELSKTRAEATEYYYLLFEALNAIENCLALARQAKNYDERGPLIIAARDLMEEIKQHLNYVDDQPKTFSQLADEQGVKPVEDIGNLPTTDDDGEMEA